MGGKYGRFGADLTHGRLRTVAAGAAADLAEDWGGGELRGFLYGGGLAGGGDGAFTGGGGRIKIGLTVIGFTAFNVGGGGGDVQDVVVAEEEKVEIEEVAEGAVEDSGPGGWFTSLVLLSVKSLTRN